MLSLINNCFVILHVMMTVISATVVKIPLKTSSLFTDIQLEQQMLLSKQNLSGVVGQGYHMELSIGNPTQTINVLVDTGSSNFAVAANNDPKIDKFFNISRSGTAKPLYQQVYVSYTQGSWSGELVRDQITSLANFSIWAEFALISSSERFFINGSQWQGILGLAYREIARPYQSVEPFLDSFFRQTRYYNGFTMELCSTDFNSTLMTGQLILGGVDDLTLLDTMSYAALNREWYYDVTINEIRVDDVPLNIDCKEYNFDKTIIDSGTTNIHLPRRVHSQLISLIKSSVQTEIYIPELFWHGLELVCISYSQLFHDNLPSLTFNLASSTFTSVDLTITAVHYLRILADGQNSCYKFAIVAADSGTILGATFMQAFLVFFDRHNKRIGFSRSRCYNDTTSVIHSISLSSSSDCTYHKPIRNSIVLSTVSYVFIVLCLLCLIPVIAIIIWYHLCRQQQSNADISSLIE